MIAEAYQTASLAWRVWIIVGRNLAERPHHDAPPPFFAVVV